MSLRNRNAVPFRCPAPDPANAKRCYARNVASRTTAGRKILQRGDELLSRIPLACVLGPHLLALQIGNEVENYGRGNPPSRTPPWTWQEYRNEYSRWHHGTTGGYRADHQAQRRERGWFV